MGRVPIAAVELENNLVVNEHLLVLDATVTTARAENLLVPTARGGDVRNHEQRLRSDAHYSPAAPGAACPRYWPTDHTLPSGSRALKP